jgi:membrane protease subunit HflK
MSSDSGNEGPWGSSGDSSDDSSKDEKKKSSSGQKEGGKNPWSNGASSGGAGKDFKFGVHEGGKGPGGRGGQGPDFEDAIKRGQEAFQSFMPEGFGGSLMLILALIIGGWFLTGFFRVQPDEQGVVLRFGKMTRVEQPGLRYHMPAPIEKAFTPKVTKVNKTEIGFLSPPENARNASARDVADESLMLTGDENIIDIDATVFWVIKDAGKYLFKVRNPEMTVKKAAESALREVIGQIDIQPALTEARQRIEERTNMILQTMLDDYESGIEVTQVQLQKVDPPAAVIDAFNDVQRARADKERAINVSESYRNSIIPVARGDAEKVLQDSAAYKEQQVNFATGDASRFRSVLDAYRANRDVTADRMYFEAIEEVMKDTPKIIIDKSAQGGQGVVPYLPLTELQKKQPQKTPSN